MQQGEEIMVNPMDPDEVHIEDHTKRVLQEAQAPDPDQNLLAKAQEHIVRHHKQLAMKRMMQAAMQGAGQVLGGMPQQGMGQPQQGQPQQNPMAAMMGGPQQ